MSDPIRAASVVSGGDPNAAGRTLADYVLRKKLVTKGLKIDLRGLPPGLLISGFYNAFLQRIHEQSPDLLKLALKTKWQHQYPFQDEAAERTVKDFKPREPSSTGAARPQ